MEMDDGLLAEFVAELEGGGKRRRGGGEGLDFVGTRRMRRRKIVRPPSFLCPKKGRKKKGKRLGP